MPWPTPQDYQEALQNPDRSLTDPELRVGRVELDPLGLPKPRTGGFASVYRVHCRQGEWAVRCFLRDFQDQQERYAAISDHLAKVKLPYTVDFTFLPQGIRVRGQWYPILKMQWVEGERLDHYIERHLRSPSVLLVLAAQWIEMVKALQQASIAHGDLQHGNVLVVQGNLKLIDYDGMFVPRLHGRVSHEVGHRNYQHPLRAASDFGPHLDNFSVWVVYMSLIVLSVAPELWTRFRGGDECLLFRRQDFERPNNSDILRALERFRDERIQSATTLFKSLLYLEPQQVPLLDGQLTTLPSPPEMALPIWLKDYVKPKLGEVASVGKPMVPEPSSTVVDPSWIFDFLGTGDSPRPSVLFKNSAVIERVLLAVSVIIGASLVIFISPAGSELNIVGLLSVVLMNLVLWVYRYRSEPALAELFTMQFEVYPIVKTKISMA